MRKVRLELVARTRANSEDDNDYDELATFAKDNDDKEDDDEEAYWG
jgi:hypothetical protein